MEKNMFENAYFGKAYKTRDGRKFVYLGEVESLFSHDSAIQGMIEDNDILTYYNSEGKSLYCEYKGSAINAFDIDFSQVICEEDCETGLVCEPAIGTGRSYRSYDYYNGYYDGYVDMYFKCPHCGKIFYVEV